MSQPKVRVVAIIQARMGSSRRPGKTLADISGKPLIWHVVERTRASQMVDSVVLATTTEENDQQLLNIAEEYGILGYAGSLNDVLDRFYQAACLARAEVIDVNVEKNRVVLKTQCINQDGAIVIDGQATLSPPKAKPAS